MGQTGKSLQFFVGAIHELPLPNLYGIPTLPQGGDEPTLEATWVYGLFLTPVPPGDKLQRYKPERLTPAGIHQIVIPAPHFYGVNSSGNPLAFLIKTGFRIKCGMTGGYFENGPMGFNPSRPPLIRGGTVRLPLTIRGERFVFS